MGIRLIIAFLITIGVTIMIVATIPTEKPPADGVSAARRRYSSLFKHERRPHLGLIEFRDGFPWVIEVTDKVTQTPWVIWWKKGKDHRLAILRLPNLTPADARAIVQDTESSIGRPTGESELMQQSFDRGAHVTLAGDIAADPQLQTVWSSLTETR